MNRLSLIDHTQAERRLDHYLFGLYRDTPGSHVQKMIRTGRIRVNEQRVPASYRLQLGDRVSHPQPKALEVAGIPPLHRNQLPQQILWETEDLLVVNKPAGVPVQAGSGYPYGWVEQLSKTLETPLHLVHRLDRLTSGVMLIAKHPNMQAELSRQFRDRSIEKIYECVVHGPWPQGDLFLEAPLLRVREDFADRSIIHPDGLRSISLFSLEAGDRVYSRLTVQIMTGRMHQIRAHCAALGHPIVGDTLYGAPKHRLGFMLLSQSIGFDYQGKRHRFQAHWPEDKAAWIHQLGDEKL